MRALILQWRHAKASMEDADIMRAVTEARLLGNLCHALSLTEEDAGVGKSLSLKVVTRGRLQVLAKEAIKSALADKIFFAERFKSVAGRKAFVQIV